MHYLLTFLFGLTTLLAASAQNKSMPDYARDWKRADSLAARGLPKSALEIANRIYTEAKAQQNYPQVAKAAMSRMIFRSYADEDAYKELVRSLRADVADTPEPAKSVLQSVLADVYWQYFQQNRYKFYDRATMGRATMGKTMAKPDTNPATTPNDSSTDFTTWDARHLVNAITQLYLASVQDKNLLQKTPIAAYNALLDKGDPDARLLRPTLYDLLAHRAITFFQNTEPDLLKPVFRFEQNQDAYLAAPEPFTKFTIQSPDSLSGQYQALRLYQQLLTFHLTDKTLDALADADVLRLEFAHRTSILPNRDSLYRKTLESQITRYKNSPVEAVYGFQLAQFLANTGANARPLDEGDDLNPKPDPARWHRKQAADICRDLAKRFPTTLAGKQAAQLLDRLLRPTLTVQVEDVNAPKQAFRILVSYQNVSRITYRIINLSAAEKQTLQAGYGDDEQRKKQYGNWLKRPVVIEKTVSLPNDGDLNQHTVEVPIAAVAIGHYLLLATADEKFLAKTETVQFANFTVSELSYLLTADQSNQIQTVLVTNRLTGEPVKNATVTVVGVNSAEPLLTKKIYKTDANGWVKIPTFEFPEQTNFQYLITLGADTLLSDRQYNYRHGNTDYQEQIQTRSNLFTDRAIYRPGQLIYVKGLIYTGKTNAFSVVANQDVLIELLDQNGERIAKQTLKTNEFGTFAATFTAPVGRLTGQMTLQTPYGGTGIRVEEYKRPTFEVKTQPIKQSFTLGDSVTVSATAKTFSGAVVDGAEVRYRVVRKFRPRWYWWYGYDSYRGSQPSRGSEETEITNGTAQTDAQGNISVTFAATPDLTKARGTNPIFNFELTIDVTDRAGETRSATQTLSIGYSALQISLGIPPQVEINGPATFPVNITNQSGEKATAKGQLKIYRLQPPARPLRERLWTRPDRQLLTRAEFEKLFPNDVYASENDPRTWPKGELVQQQTITSPADSLIKLNLSKFTPGEYVAEFTITDPASETSTERAFFAAVNDNQPTASARPDNWVQVRKANAEPGGEAVFWVGNSQPGWVLMTVEENRKVVRQEWLKTDGKPRRVTLPVTEKQRGGFAVHFLMVQNERLYQKEQTITVPFTNKQLTIETETFRNKLKPGEREEWTLRVKGLDKTPAELVATLYDASLDTFVPFDWPTSFYSPYSTVFYGWRSGCFDVQASQALFYRFRPELAVPARKYDQLLAGYGDRRSRIFGREMLSRGAGSNFEPNLSMAKMAAPMQAKADEEAPEEAAPRAGIASKPAEPKPADAPPVNPRRNFNETAFFLPQLKTDEQGRVVLKFTMPEALTRWRLLAFAHTKDLKTGTLEREIITQKELMITANAPRFLREGDTIRIQARVNNLSEKPLDVTATLTLLNALTGQPVSQSIVKSSLQTTATVAAGQGQAVGWTLVIPSGLDAVTCRFTAQAGSFTDGEEFTVPILPNRMLVTDTKPFWVNGPETKTFKLNELVSLNPKLPAQHERLTVEVTSNPSWYALQSLPYLMEYRYECAEQLFSRMYANSLAAHIVNSKPAFRQVIDEWQKNPPKSPLETNEELKAVALENSPWLVNARSETERQAKLGQLLDANRMENEQRRAFAKLEQLQTSDGGFRWFGGMDPDLSMTLHILSGFGHLTKIGVKFPDDLRPQITDMQANAIRYVDAEMKRRIEERKKVDAGKKGKLTGPWYFSATQYLYARSFYMDKPVDKAVLTYLKAQVVADWTSQSLQGQALSAMALNRFGDIKTANGIMNSLRERSRKSEELGLYWPDNVSGLQWYQAPIETQAYLIEAFGEINPVAAEVDEMKRWLIRQKQTQSWSSTKATTEAVYALLLRGSDWLGTGVNTQVSLGGQPIESRVTKADAITGYEKVTYAASEIKPDMGNITIIKKATGPAWGALYWQHFEPLDKVMPGSAGLSVQKTLYVQRDSPGGPVITPVTEKTSLKPGDLIKVRLILKTDRLMEYVHLKDSRASGFEPVAALSGYKYQNGLGYYESPRDASTDFFMNYLPVGTHVFEYELRVAQTGDFSAGVATVQCFYAPEFSAHSAGVRVEVK
ncbi:MAG: alpha-2-macroglobulin [Spirosoma sp.]|nr:alpha-2-macroglobulin [Spirosoma sp.]